MNAGDCEVRSVATLRDADPDESCTSHSQSGGGGRDRAGRRSRGRVRSGVVRLVLGAPLVLATACTGESLLNPANVTGEPSSVSADSALVNGAAVARNDLGFGDRGDYTNRVRNMDRTAKAVPISKAKINTPSRKLAADGFRALKKNDLKRASKLFNRALKLDIRSSYLQFLNALTYHLLAQQGDAQSLEMAEEGYKIASRFDQANWLARFYLGHLYMDQRKFGPAQDAFAQAAYLKPRNREVLFQLAAASYYAGDPVTADAVLQRVQKLGVDAAERPRLLQALVVTNAAMNRSGLAYNYLEDYRAVADNGKKYDHLSDRVADWNTFYKTVQFSSEPSADMNAPVQNGFGAPAAPGDQAPPPSPGQYDMGGFKNQGMVAVDVVIIGTEQDITDSAGVNLLSGLRIQFGDPFSGLAAFSFRRDKTRDLVDPAGDSHLRTITQALSIPAISYSLNIANSDSSRNEILAKPTLASLHGETSEFFSGVDVNAAAVSGAAGDSVRIEKEIGVRLRVMPEILPDDKVKLKVIAERTFLTQPSQSVVFQFRLDTSKTSVNANVAMKFGETLILSGLSEKENENNRNGVPGFQDVPILQYFFSRSEKRDFKKSVLILLTPRRPSYMDPSPAEANKRLGELSKRERAIERLSQRYRDWFRPYSNLKSIFQELDSNRLYAEFRNGDFPLENWRESPTHSERLRKALQWLYY